MKPDTGAATVPERGVNGGATGTLVTESTSVSADDVVG